MLILSANTQHLAEHGEWAGFVQTIKGFIRQENTKLTQKMTKITREMEKTSNRIEMKLDNQFEELNSTILLQRSDILTMKKNQAEFNEQMVELK